MGRKDTAGHHWYTPAEIETIFKKHRHLLGHRLDLIAATKKVQYKNKAVEKQLLPNHPFQPKLNLKSVKIDETKTPRTAENYSVENRLISYRDLYDK